MASTIAASATYSHNALCANLDTTFVLVMNFTDAILQKRFGSFLISYSVCFGTMDVRSEAPKQHKNDNDNQDRADDTDTTVAVAVTVAAEPAAEAAK
jgi:hypothetical protein